IPLRLRPGQSIPFRPEDVILQTGDIVHVRAREAQLFYTGGLLPSGVYPLPRDYDIDVVQAILQVGGPLVAGGINPVNIGGVFIQEGLGIPSPSLVTVLRRTPGGGQVPIRVDLAAALKDPRERILLQAGDVLIMQEKPAEAIVRYLTQRIRLDSFFRII